MIDVSKKLEEATAREAKATTDLEDLKARLQVVVKENAALEEKRKAAMAQTERSYRQLAQMDRTLVERERELLDIRASTVGDSTIRDQVSPFYPLQPRQFFTDK